MKKMTAGEFKRYIESNNHKLFVYNSENQSWDSVLSSMSVCFKFDSIVVAVNPNIVCLKNGGNVMYFNRVKYINIDSEKINPLTIMDIVCKDEKNYTIVAS